MKKQDRDSAGLFGVLAFAATTVVLASAAYFGLARHAAPSRRVTPPLHLAERAASPAPVAAPEVELEPAPAIATAASPAPPAIAEEPAADVPGALPPPPALPAQASPPAAELPQDPAWKTQKTQAIAKVVTGRAERLERDIAERERLGDAAGAARLRVLRARLSKQLQAMDGEIAELAQPQPEAPL